MIKNLRDEELIFFIGVNSEEAFNILLKRYEQKINAIAVHYFRSFPNSGITVDELKSVACESLLTAAKKYDLNGAASFYSYWKTIVNNAISKYLTKNSYTSKKQSNIVFSLDEVIDGSHASIESIVSDSSEDKTTDTLYQHIKEMVLDDKFELGMEEKGIFISYLTGFEVDEIHIAFPNFGKSTIYKIIKKGKDLLAKRFR